ncbi:MAG TPA: DUF3368 domain-containing protein [bacterium]|nr:DUF3368 domain-containing protein [bacterium]
MKEQEKYSRISRPIVSDASPIIIFARSTHLSLLRDVTGSLIIPKAVYDEIVGGGRNFQEAEEIKKADWIRVEHIGSTDELEELPKALGQGEKEAIILAKRLNTTILIDDLYARREAKRYGLYVIGSLGIIYIAKEKGIITDAKGVLDSLIEAGYYLDNNLYNSFLKELEEAGWGLSRN